MNSVFAIIQNEVTTVFEHGIIINFQHAGITTTTRIAKGPDPHVISNSAVGQSGAVLHRPALLVIERSSCLSHTTVNRPCVIESTGVLRHLRHRAFVT